MPPIVTDENNYRLVGKPAKVSNNILDQTEKKDNASFS